MNKVFVAFAFVFFAGYAFYNNYEVKRELLRANFKISLLEAENRLLTGENEQLDRRPTYEAGYTDAIIRMGGPKGSGSYQDGWDAALKTVDGGYQDGYHAAIKQFGYVQNKDFTFIVPEKIESKNNIIPTKLIEDKSK